MARMKQIFTTSTTPIWRASFMSHLLIDFIAEDKSRAQATLTVKLSEWNGRYSRPGHVLPRPRVQQHSVASG
jgi:hypothetical protein